MVLDIWETKRKNNNIISFVTSLLSLRLATNLRHILIYNECVRLYN